MIPKPNRPSCVSSGIPYTQLATRMEARQCKCLWFQSFFAHHHVVLFCASLEVCFPRLAKSFTGILESGLVDLAIALDDINLSSNAVGKCGDLPGALVPAYCSSATVESLDKNDSLVEVMAKPFVSALSLSALHPCSKMGDPLFVK
jgi:hypothetical protein